LWPRLFRTRFPLAPAGLQAKEGRMKPVLLSFASLILLAQPSNINYVMVCGAHLTIGMQQATALRQVRSACDAKLAAPRTPSSQAEMWDLWELSPNRQAGHLIFDGSKKLINADRSRVETTDSQELVEAFYFAAKDFAVEGHTACSLGTRQFEHPQISGQVVVLTCGGKELLVSSDRFSKGIHSEGVAEHLF
jgi:hypothetical protein